MVELLEPDDVNVCGESCACHGDVVCLRPKHPHEPDDVHPHLGRHENGNFVQWVHTSDDGPKLTADEVKAQQRAAMTAHTKALLAGLDHDLLREALAGQPMPPRTHATEGP